MNWHLCSPKKPSKAAGMYQQSNIQTILRKESRAGTRAMCKNMVTLQHHMLLHAFSMCVWARRTRIQNTLFAPLHTLQKITMQIKDTTVVNCQKANQNHPLHFPVIPMEVVPAHSGKLPPSLILSEKPKPNQNFPPGFKGKDYLIEKLVLWCVEQATHTFRTRPIDNAGASCVSTAHHRIKTYKNEHKPCNYSWEHDSTATGKTLEDHLQKTYRLVAARLHPWIPRGRIQNPLVVQVWQGILTAWERRVSESAGKRVKALYTPQMDLEMCMRRRMRHGSSGEGGDDDDGDEEENGVVTLNT